MFSVVLVCLFVIVSNITQNVMNKLRSNFRKGSEVVKGTSNYVLVDHDPALVEIFTLNVLCLVSVIK